VGAAVKPRLLPVVILSAAWFSSALLGMPRGQQAVFRAAVDIVRLDVRVTSGGRPIPGLNTSDFAVTDNGVPQQLKIAATEGDVAVALVLDGGPIHGGPGSTVVDCTGERPMILRAGAIPPLGIAAALDEAGIPHDVHLPR